MNATVRKPVKAVLPGVALEKNMRLRRKRCHTEFAIVPNGVCKSAKNEVSSLYLLNDGDAMKAQIQKWGNSLAVRIPKSFAAELNVEQGAAVDMTVEDGAIIIRPITAPQFSLDELLSKVTRGNIHREVDSGDAQGQELW